MITAVVREVAVVAVDHRRAGTHLAREVEGRESGTKCEGRERVPEIVDPPQRPNPCSLLRRSPLERTEVVDVEITSSPAREEQLRAVARDAVECVECPRLERDRPHARVRLGDLELAAREGAANEEDTLLAVDVAF